VCKESIDKKLAAICPVRYSALITDKRHYLISEITEIWGKLYIDLPKKEQ
jgi:hypothetical protein